MSRASCFDCGGGDVARVGAGRFPACMSRSLMSKMCDDFSVFMSVDKVLVSSSKQTNKYIKLTDETCPP